MATFQIQGFDKPAEFRLVKCIEDETWLAERTSDCEPFIARRLEELDEYVLSNPDDRSPSPSSAAAAGRDPAYADDPEGLTKLLSECGFDGAIARLLNHENIVSLASFINEGSALRKDGKVARVWVVWDYYDAGNLRSLFEDKRLKRDYDGTRYLPESLVWHVLRSILRALVWLHDGTRLFCEEGEGPTEQSLRGVDDDWMPVLHGAITPDNIYFQHPRGREEYGVCKLNNFGKAFVSGKVKTSGMPREYQVDQGKGVVASLPDGKMGTVEEIRLKLQEDQETWVPNNAYTVNDELWDLGATVHTMMVGAPPPSRRGCPKCSHKCSHLQVCAETDTGCIRTCDCEYGGCAHVQGKHCAHPTIKAECDHPCGRKDVRFQDNLWKKNYSRYIIEAVLGLLQPRRKGESEDVLMPGSTSVAWEEVERQYAGWLHNTEEGQEFFGIDDDLVARAQYTIKKEKREARRKRKQAKKEFEKTELELLE